MEIPLVAAPLDPLLTLRYWASVALVSMLFSSFVENLLRQNLETRERSVGREAQMIPVFTSAMEKMATRG